MANSVYFASTILHLYAAAVIAAERKDEDAHLIFMDQPEDRPYPLYDIVRQWPESPFKSVQLFYGRFPGLLNKLKKRKQLFRRLEQEIQRLRPANIFVGNDRRIEFQFAMHIAETAGCRPVGHYMDEGTFTYVGRKASGSISDTLIDNWAKKISYGLWWKNPPTVGGSEWISCVHAAFPELIHPLLQSKRVIPLNAAGFVSPAMLSLSSSIMADCGFDPAPLASLDVLFTLPHESLFERDPSYKERVLTVIRQQTQEGKRVAAKYHPRNSGPDVLSLAAAGVTLLPAQVSFEALLPHLPEQCEIWGDLSSTLLIARWLRPELQVTSLVGENPDPAFSALFKQLGIRAIKTRD